MDIGFTGTQRGMTEAQIETITDILFVHEPAWVHHGDCIGADAEFHDLARNAGARVHIHPPDNPSKRAWCVGDKVSPELPYLQRNKRIVASSDLLIAAPGESEEQLRSGTWSTWRYADKSWTDWILVYPDGETYSHGSI